MILPNGFELGGLSEQIPLLLLLLLPQQAINLRGEKEGPDNIDELVRALAEKE